MPRVSDRQVLYIALSQGRDTCQNEDMRIEVMLAEDLLQERARVTALREMLNEWQALVWASEESRIQHAAKVSAALFEMDKES